MNQRLVTLLSVAVLVGGGVGGYMMLSNGGAGGGGHSPDGIDAIDGAMPQDVDGDGLVMDLNANGRLDHDDLVTYFDYMNDPEIRNNTEYYDYNENGRIDFDDVTILQESI